MHKSLQLLVALTVCSGTAYTENAAGTDERELDELVVYGRAQSLIGAAQSSSEGIVGYDDIALPPLLRVGELVEAVPGMVATQHSGTGKANQYFVRGFNLDHGTDFSVSVEGVPINLRSHGHGQGYLDLNFLIPELIETTSYRRGPYSAQVGDFSSAASVEFNFYERLPESVTAATVGEDGYYRALAAGSTDAGRGVLTGALDFTRNDGPWQLDENLEQLKFHGAYGFDRNDARARLTVGGYDSRWNATDQVPQRAIAGGAIRRLGYIDPDLGGHTERFAITGALDFGSWAFNAYAVDYDFALFSNFTYFLDNPVDGDEFEQRDARRIYGIGLNGSRQLDVDGRAVELRWGGDFRYDDIDEVGLYRTAARARHTTVREDSVMELSLSTWGEVEFGLTHRLRAVVGARADYYDWQVRAFREENSGSGNDTLVSPKATLAYQFNEGLEGYANWGRGFHSNDVRGVTLAVDPQSGDPVDAVDALVSSNGAEVGLRFERGQEFNAALAAFWLELDSELVYVGDAGTTEPNDATERVGFEATVFWQQSEWLALNASYAVTDARFKADQGGGREIPGAVRSTATLGVNGAWDNGLRASSRLRWLSESPLSEDNSLRSDDSLLLNAGLAWRRGRAEYRLDVFNLLDSGDNDIAYLYKSRLQNEPAQGIDDLHLHPLEPRTVRASVTLHWE